MSGTESLGNDPRWSAAMRNLAAAVIAGAPATAQAAICTVFGAGETFNCTVEYGPDIGMVDLQESVYYAAAELIEVWFAHNSEFPGLTFCLTKQYDGDWQIDIDFAGHGEHQVQDADGWDQDSGYSQGGQGHEHADQSADSDQAESRQPRRRSPRAGMVQDESAVVKPKMVKIAVIAAVVLLVFGGIGGAVFFLMGNQKPAEAPMTYEQRRKAFETELTKRAEAPQEFDNEAPDAVKVVEYPSGDRQLTAWLILPDREPPFPAVVFAHDGYALQRSDYDSAMPFVAQGFAVLIPSFRGENGNPGDFEMCYGEVDDLVNAIGYMATRKKVDADSIFAAGQGVGGTNVMLAAELSPYLRKAAALGGRPDMLEAKAAYEDAPFDQHDEKELLMRSPARFLDDMKCPMLLLYAEKEPADKLFLEQAQKMEKESKKQPILVEELPGVKRQTSLAPAISRMMTFFNAR